MNNNDFKYKHTEYEGSKKISHLLITYTWPFLLLPQFHFLHFIAALFPIGVHNNLFSSTLRLNQSTNDGFLRMNPISLIYFDFNDVLIRMIE